MDFVCLQKKFPGRGAFRPGIYRGWGRSGYAAVPVSTKRGPAKAGSKEMNKNPEVGSLGHALLTMTAGAFSMASFSGRSSLGNLPTVRRLWKLSRLITPLTRPTDRALCYSGDIRMCWRQRRLERTWECQRTSDFSEGASSRILWAASRCRARRSSMFSPSTSAEKAMAA